MGRHNKPKTPISARAVWSGLGAAAAVMIAVSVVLVLLLTELEVI